MGLEALVYRDISSIPPELVSRSLECDPETGELFYPNATRPLNLPNDFAVARRIHLGNIGEIAGLRREVSQILGDSALIITKVLFSGSHSGDVIPPSFFNELEAELRRLELHPENLSHPVADMTFNLLELIEEAKRQNNPIVFV